MKTEEFRLNNLVLHCGLLCRIVSIDEHGATVIDDNGDLSSEVYSLIEAIKPVPISEERLLGFVKESDYNFSTGIHQLWKDGTNNQWYFVWHFQRKKFYKAIKYVHQLQNIYFALTSEELQIK